MSQGVTIFPTLVAALNAGYQVVDRHYEVTPGRWGMLVRTKTTAGWAHALVAPRPSRGDDAA